MRRRSGRPWPSIGSQVVLLVGLRLGALLLYRPGGYFGVMPPYPALSGPLTDLLGPAWQELGRQLLVGLALLPGEIATLLLLYWLARQHWSEARARRTALFWSLLGLPLHAWLVSPAGLLVLALLSLLALLERAGRGGQVLGLAQRLAIILALQTSISTLALLGLLPLIALLLPTTQGAWLVVGLSLLSALTQTALPSLFGAAVGWNWTGVLLLVGQWFLAGALGWKLLQQSRRGQVPLALPRLLSRPQTLRALVGCWVVAGLLVGWQEYRVLRLAASPFAPLAAEWAEGAPGMVLLGDWDLHDELYAWGGSRHLMRVVTAKNRDALQQLLGSEGGPVWIIRRDGTENRDLLSLAEWLASERASAPAVPLGNSQVLRFDVR
jgi:hypothetical protein